MYTFNDLLGASARFVYKAVRHPHSLDFTLRISEITGLDGKTVHYEYDDERRTGRAILPDGQTFTFPYNPRQERRATLDPRTGELLHRVHDAGDTEVRTYSYDPKNGMTVEPGTVTTYTYDERGELISVESPPGTVTTFIYDVEEPPENGMGA